MRLAAIKVLEEKDKTKAIEEQIYQTNQPQAPHFRLVRVTTLDGRPKTAYSAGR